MEKKTVIEIEKIKDKVLSEINASDFILALEAVDLPLQGIITKDKRAEYVIEPEDLGKVRLKDFIRVTKDWQRWRWAEKKKVELEPLPELGVSRIIYEKFLDRLVQDLETRLGR